MVVKEKFRRDIYSSTWSFTVSPSEHWQRAASTPSTYPAVWRDPMAAPSFSSFPPSFGSFPDVPGPSKLQDRSEDKSRKQRRRLSSSPDDKPSSERKEKDGKTREKHRSKSREQHKSARASADRHSSTDKHRRMDKHPSAKHEWEDLGVERDIESFRKEALGDKDSRPVFFIDRKGDQLNVRYGGLHAGDIPKYKLIDRELR